WQGGRRRSRALRVALEGTIGKADVDRKAWTPVVAPEAHLAARRLDHRWDDEVRARRAWQVGERLCGDERGVGVPMIVGHVAREPERGGLDAVRIEEGQLGAAPPAVLRRYLVWKNHLHELDARVATAPRHDLVQLNQV